MSQEPKPWQTQSTRVILDLSPWFSVVKDSVALPSGRIVDDFYRIAAPDYVLIAARAERQFLMEQHYKHCLQRNIITCPAGGVNDGEAPLDAAKRELLEETGYEAAQWEELGSFVVDGTRGICRAHFFLAEGLTWTTTPVSNDMEECQLLFMSDADIRQAVRTSDICLLPDIALLSMLSPNLLQRAP